MSDRPDIPEDFEPTIRIDRPREAEDTGTRKLASPPEKKAGDSGITGRFLAHFTGIFRRRDGVFEPVPLERENRHVSLEVTDTANFTPLENAYERTEELGAGGQARLYRGFDLHLHRQVAIKSLREEQGKDPELRNKFVSEAMITAQLDHPAIVPVYSIHRDAENRLHLAMKLINGRPFQNYLADLVRHYDRDGFSSAEEQRSLNYRLEVFLSVCDALEYAHNRNIMHCDLKPENIMIGEYHEAYLMDWGLARRIDDPELDPEEWESPGTITGMPRFLSPEAVRGERCDQRADIYALGLILYEVVTLRYAYEGNDHRETINRIRRGEMRPVTHRFGCAIPADLRKIILKAAAWDRERRYKSVEEFSADVRKFIRGEEVSANPDTFFGRLARAGYRRRRMMLSLSLGLVALGAVAVAFSLYDRIAADKLEAARTEFRHNRERILNRALGEAIGVGRVFDRQISKVEHGLFSVATEALLLLNADITVNNSSAPIWTVEGLYRGRRPESMKFAPGFGFDIDLENFFCHVAPGSSPAEWENRVRRMRLLQPRMLRAVIESRPDSVLSAGNMELLKARVRNSGSPLANIYLGFGDGLFISYPGDKIDRNYDHRKRQWYKERVDGTRDSMSLLWRNPYLSINNEMVLSCTMPMIDTGGHMHGVAGIDVSLPAMIAELRRAGNNGKALLDKSLVDSDGNVIADIEAGFMEATRRNDTVENGKVSLVRYSDNEMLEWIKTHRTGYRIRNENGRAVVYVFSRLYTVNWFYIEKIDLLELLRERGVAVPPDMAATD